MSDIKVTRERIDHLLNSANVKVETVFGKCTTVVMQLENGFILTESSACVDPENYDPQLGKKLCYKHIENRLRELEGYALQKDIYEREKSGACKCDSASPVSIVEECKITGMNFGQAIEAAKKGLKIARKGWNGKNQHVELAVNISYQTPDGDIQSAEHEAIGNAAFAFCGTSGVQMGWLASQADMLADDWEIVE